MTELEHFMEQHAPYPTVLDDLVRNIDYKAGWAFKLVHMNRGQGSEGLTLIITIVTPNSYNSDQMRRVHHYMIVPSAAYDERSWQHWVFSQILLVEQHEAMEFFQVMGQRPYPPSHGPGNDPYLIREVGTVTDARTSFTGEVNPE